MVDDQATPPIIEELAERIAWHVLPHSSDAKTRISLQKLLIGFAAEIRRSAIEP